SEIFDDIAQILGSGISRRKALKLALAGLAGAALAELGIRSSWAAGNCLCRGQLYDPQESCCTPTGVEPKWPIRNLDSCPSRVPHPGYVPTTNGCGPSGSPVTPFIPNHFGLANFGSCCNGHDSCYGTCNNVRSSCDNAFLPCLRSACSRAYDSFFLVPL